MIWKADQLQAVLFPAPSAPQPDAMEAWSVVTRGGTPLSFQRPDVSPVSISLAEGMVEGLRLVVQAQLGRIDFVLLPPTPSQILTYEPPRIENVVEASCVLRNVTDRALEKIDPIRIGVIANLSEIQATQEAASLRMTELCGGAWFPSPALDCVYQINSRRQAHGVPRCELNRVCTWTSGNYTMMAQPQNIYMSPATVPLLARVLPFVSLKVDVNSVTSSVLGSGAVGVIEDASEELLLIAANGLGHIR